MTSTSTTGRRCPAGPGATHTRRGDDLITPRPGGTAVRGHATSRGGVKR